MHEITMIGRPSTNCWSQSQHTCGLHTLVYNVPDHMKIIWKQYSIPAFYKL